MKGADILCGMIARRIFKFYNARFMRDIIFMEEMEMETIKKEKEKPYAVYDPKSEKVLMEFDDVLSAKRFGRAVKNSVGHDIILVDRRNGAFTGLIF